MQPLAALCFEVPVAALHRLLCEACCAHTRITDRHICLYVLHEAILLYFGLRRDDCTENITPFSCKCTQEQKTNLALRSECQTSEITSQQKAALVRASAIYLLPAFYVGTTQFLKSISTSSQPFLLTDKRHTHTQRCCPTSPSPLQQTQ